MDRFYPRADFAEDQEYSKVILYSHLAHKGLQAGSIIGGITGLVAYFVSKSRKAGGLPSTISKFSNYGALSGPFVVCGLGYSRMAGKEEIEWKDRAWRLERNEKLKTVDTFTDLAVAGSLLFKGTPIGLGVCASVFSGVAYLNFLKVK